MRKSEYQSQILFLKYVSLKRPQYEFATYKLFIAITWHDRRDVTFLSTVHSAAVEFTVVHHLETLKNVQEAGFYPKPMCYCRSTIEVRLGLTILTITFPIILFL